MSIIDKQLKGNNLCNTSCSEQDQIIHPETCAKSVLMSCENQDNLSLEKWITKDSNNHTYNISTSLMDWLQTYFDDNVPLNLPKAGINNLGCIQLASSNSYLSVDNNGYISVDVQSLNIPEAYILPAATDSALGGGMIDFKLDGDLTEKFNQIIDNDEYHFTPIYDNTLVQEISKVDCYLVPIDILNDFKFAARIPINLFDYNDIRNTPSSQAKSDWNENDPSSPAYILHKPTLSINNNTITIGNNSLTIPQSDWKQNNSSALDYIQHKPVSKVFVEDINKIIDGDIDEINEIINAYCVPIIECDTDYDLNKLLQVLTNNTENGFNGKVIVYIKNFSGAAVEVSFELEGENTINCYADVNSTLKYLLSDTTVYLEIPDERITKLDILNHHAESSTDSILYSIEYKEPTQYTPNI